jgi:hypothetical protein
VGTVEQHAAGPCCGVIGRRIVPTALAAAVAVATVSACGSGGSPGASSSTGAASAASQPGATSPQASSTGPTSSASVSPSGAVSPPAGNQLQDVLRGKGVLVYRCTAGKYSLARTSVQLFVDHGGFAGTQPGLLSWRFKNGTRVDAAIVKEVRRPAALSQALMKVVKVTGGDANDRASTFVVRQPDPGGVPPRTCPTAGKLVSVPFQTRYVFYRSATPGRPASAGATA